MVVIKVVGGTSDYDSSSYGHGNSSNTGESNRVIIITIVEVMCF